MESALKCLSKSFFRGTAACFGRDQGDEIAFFLFHGFPADSQKNEDLALALCQNTSADIYLIHQTGLGESSGEFSFTGSIAEAEMFIQDAVHRRNYKSVVLIGHSWGGYLALAIAKKRTWPELRIVLLSPLFLLPSAASSRPMLEDFAASRCIADSEYVDRLMEETDQLRSVDVVPSAELGRRILIVHGRKDSVVPVASTENLMTKVPSATVMYTDDDHWFSTNRSKVIATVTNWLLDQGIK